MAVAYIRGQEHGSVAILGLITMMLLGIIGSGFLMLSKIDIEIAGNHRDGIAAQYLAEAGVQLSIVKLKTDPNFVIQTGANNITITNILDFEANSQIYKVTTGPDNQTSNKDIRLIRSIGTVNKAKRQVTAHVFLSKNQVEALKIIWGN